MAGITGIGDVPGLDEATARSIDPALLEQIVQMLLANQYAQAGQHVSPLPGMFPANPGAPGGFDPFASQGGADPFTQPGVDYLPGIQYNPTDQTAPMGP